MTQFPLHGKEVITTADARAHEHIDLRRQTLLPVDGHPGAFGTQRKHHLHEGIDIYCNPGEAVFAIEAGVVVAIEDFTGADVGSPWWNSTKAILIESASGVICYGEVQPEHDLAIGKQIAAGQKIAEVVTVLKKDKGRPMTMLHLELHCHGTRETKEWPVAEGDKRPDSLRDPTPLLRDALKTQ